MMTMKFGLVLAALAVAGAASATDGAAAQLEHDFAVTQRCTIAARMAVLGAKTHPFDTKARFEYLQRGLDAASKATPGSKEHLPTVVDLSFASGGIDAMTPSERERPDADEIMLGFAAAQCAIWGIRRSKDRLEAGRQRNLACEVDSDCVRGESCRSKSGGGTECRAPRWPAPAGPR